MAQMPKVQSRNMAQLMQSVVDTHQRIHDSIVEHATELEAAKRAENERMNAEALLGHKRPATR